jgi:hypothetical protein
LSTSSASVTTTRSSVSSEYGNWLGGTTYEGIKGATFFYAA